METRAAISSAWAEERSCHGNVKVTQIDLGYIKVRFHGVPLMGRVVRATDQLFGRICGKSLSLKHYKLQVFRI